MTCTCFNSTMVRLKVHDHKGKQEPNHSFNSTMVRLKVMCQRRGWVLSYKFQFHNGSIKSHITTLLTAPVKEFQFHNGSIKSGDIAVG